MDNMLDRLAAGPGGTIRAVMESEDIPRGAVSAHADFLQRALAAAGEWTRFTDPKVIAVLVFLGLGVTDLIDHASALVDAHDSGDFGGWLATLAFYTACALAVLTVVFASFALFPRPNPEERTPSLYYFGGIATFATAQAYERAVRAKSARELEGEVARQAWEVSRIAGRKVQLARYAYIAVIAFLAAWVGGRMALALN
jgi:hypothetical protein